MVYQDDKTLQLMTGFKWFDDLAVQDDFGLKIWY